MDWIKKHYDQFALALLALVLLVFSVILILRAKGFATQFSGATVTSTPRGKVSPLVLVPVEEARKALENPPQWADAESRKVGTVEKKRGQLFVSDRYVIGKDGTPKKPDKESFYTDSLTNKPIENTWFIDHNLPLLDQNVWSQDPDGDGFFNEDEWRASTNPNKKDSRPPYHTKLFVKQFIRVPFRLLFKAYDGDPVKGTPEKFTYQLDTIDFKQPSQFLKMTEPVVNTKFKLDKFEYKTKPNPSTGESEDVSELTIINVETKEPVILVLNRVTDSPDYFMDFLYEWTTPHSIFRVKKLQEFVLKPNVTEKYKLVDSKDGRGLIQAPDGKQIEILPDPRIKK